MNGSGEWWRTFFTGLFVEFWLRVPSAEQNTREADFLEKSLQVEPGARLLDIPCGGGRHCQALAERGYAMTGVDFSREFLEAARLSPEANPGTIVWEEREMRDLPWREEFDGAYCLGNSFGYLDDDGNAAFLSTLARTLKSGSRFVLDTGYIVESLLPSLQDRSWYEVGDMLVLSKRRYEPLTGRLHVEYTLFRDGHFEKRSMSVRLFTYKEVHGLFEKAGFGDIQGYSSFDREPYRLGSPRLLMIGTKGQT